jgi:acyl-CoA synthetase (AMP-forming)/AMP-acid ligase II
VRTTSPFTDALAAQPSRAVLRAGGVTFTAGDILRQSAKVVRELERNGFGPGDVAVIVVEPGATFLALVYAAMASGMTLALLDPEMGREHFRSKLAQLRPAVVVADSRLLLLQEHPLAYWLLRRWRGVPYFPSFAPSLVASVGPRLPVLRRHLSLRHCFSDQSPEEWTTTGVPRRTGEYLITYTSGTLAQPNGVVHSLEGLHESVRLLARVLGAPEGQRIATHLPHYMLLGISAGIPVYVWSHGWPPERKLRFIEEHGITTLFGPPSDFLPLMNAVESAGRGLPDCVNSILLGSAPVHAAFLHRLRRLLGAHVRVVCLYGMTENLLVATADLEEKLAFDERGDYVGRPVEGVELRCSADQELLLRSPQTYTRHLHEVRRPEWHATGDLARIRDDGSIVLLGRKKDMIIRGNFNIYPALYEETVCRIDGVGAAALVGVHDERQADEIVYLVVEPEPRGDIAPDRLRHQIAAALRDGEFAIDANALPDEIVVMTLPRSGRSQKVDKKALRRHLGGGEA